MRGSGGLAVLLLGLLAFIPVASAATIEAWPDGLSYVEPDGTQQAGRSPEGAISCAPVVLAGPVPVVAGLALIENDAGTPTACAPTLPCRAPPALLTLRSN